MYIALVFAQALAVGSLQFAAPSPMSEQAPLGVTLIGVTLSGDSTSRPRAIEFGEAYAVRLRIHRYGSYVMLPLFATQYALGSRLLKQREDIAAGTRMEGVSHSLNRAHLYTALGVGTLFVSNTTTGLWNLYDNRHNPDHRGIRTAHVLTMLLADAGFVVTGHMGSNAPTGSVGYARRHHYFAVGSMAIATVGASMMWFFDH